MQRKLDIHVEEVGYNPSAVDYFIAQEKNHVYVTPGIIFGSGALVVLEKQDERGWDLERGEVLSVEVEQYPPNKKELPDTGQKIIFGYIKDGILHKGPEDKNLLHRYRMVADEKAEYFITLFCPNPVVVLKEGRIEVVRSGEK